MRVGSENNSIPEVLNQVQFLVGSSRLAAQLLDIPAREPFHDKVVEFLDQVSKVLMKDARSKSYSDVITFAFWIRRGSVLRLKDRFLVNDDNIRFGKGVVFHIAPSNVPINFAYSLVSGILMGNVNVVRVPSKDFSQVEIIVDALNEVLEQYEKMKTHILCIRYDRNKEINDWFSSMCDMRIVWGGDQTIAELRKSPLPPRAGEISFADRYSIAVIDSDIYMAMEAKERVAQDFYNDTFFSDQNACTSPKVIIWIGSRIDEAKEVFWKAEHNLAEKKYTFQSIQGVNKLTSAYLIAAAESGVKFEKHTDNLIVRVKVSEVTGYLMDYCNNSSYFYEYDCNDVLEIMSLVNDNRCQTIAYIGNKEALMPLIAKGVKGIDRVVPMGKTMDFDLIWDGYNLPAMLTRTVVMA